jgi:L-threonylcarbamoyladenylate synthase
MKKALELLRNNQVVAMPTETVYGLAGSIESDEALRKIFSTKERPFFDPLIVHISKHSQVLELVKVFPDSAQLLTTKYWPGPLTIILEKSSKVSDLITSGLTTVALRMPNHPMALELISQFGSPLAAPSANKFGKTSPTKAQHVRDEFKGEVYVLDGGDCEVGIESTIVSLTETEPKKVILKLLRPGHIVLSELIKDLHQAGFEVEVHEKDLTVNAPGNMKHHYMPNKPLVIVESSLNGEAKIPVEYLNHFEMKLSDIPELAARELYSQLRFSAEQSHDFILFKRSPLHSGEKWDSIMDRLKKAATVKIELS